jgi:SNW domain-containing protein 1
MSLASLLPQPKNAPAPVVEKQPDMMLDPRLYVQNATQVPPRSERKKGNFVPRAIEDFGDGGAFPEIHQLQYPLDMGRKDAKGHSSQQAVVALKVDSEGRVKFEQSLARQGHRKETNVFSSFRDLIPKHFDEGELARPSLEDEAAVAEKTRKALGMIIDKKIAVAQPTHVQKQNLNEPTFIRYTPSNQSMAHNSGAKQRIIRVQEMPVDPLEPPKFKHKRLPTGPPSPPVPVMHSPPRKVTVADQQDWKIPPCISNWKNIKGYTIPLDKRLQADGRALQEVQVNDKFAKLSESLFIAERTARKEIEARSAMLKKIQRKQKEFREEELRSLAARARAAGSAKARLAEERDEDDYEAVKETEEDVEERDAREELRRDRKREMRRDLRMESRKDQAKGISRAARDADRDVSEKIALGQAVATKKGEQFDQRLFNQSEGLSSGFGDDAAYGVYDKALFKTQTSNYIYRKKDGEINTEADLERMIAKNTAKFRPDKGFAGTEEGVTEAGGRSAPVQFEKEVDDPYDLAQGKSGSKRRGGSDDDHSPKRRRR